eukprot:2960147-Rhodomonas_salina.1
MWRRKLRGSRTTGPTTTLDVELLNRFDQDLLRRLPKASWCTLAKTWSSPTFPTINHSSIPSSATIVEAWDMYPEYARRGQTGTRSKTCVEDVRESEGREEECTAPEGACRQPEDVVDVRGR